MLRACAFHNGVANCSGKLELQSELVKQTIQETYGNLIFRSYTYVILSRTTRGFVHFISVIQTSLIQNIWRFQFELLGPYYSAFSVSFSTFRSHIETIEWNQLTLSVCKPETLVSNPDTNKKMVPLVASLSHQQILRARSASPKNDLTVIIYI